MCECVQGALVEGAVPVRGTGVNQMAAQGGLTDLESGTFPSNPAGNFTDLAFGTAHESTGGAGSWGAHPVSTGSYSSPGESTTGCSSLPPLTAWAVLVMEGSDGSSPRNHRSQKNLNFPCSIVISIFHCFFKPMEVLFFIA